MTKEEFKDFFDRYFDIKENEFERVFDERFKYDYDRKVLNQILSVSKPFFELYHDKTNTEEKQRAGRILLNQFDMRSFPDVSLNSMSERLKSFFTSAVNKQINPYKLYYSTVLTNANLKRYYDKSRGGYVELYETTDRDFDNLFNCLKDTLNLDDESTVKMFEKCTSLISKTTTVKIKDITNYVKALAVWDKNGQTRKRVFNSEDVKLIFQNNPSLYSSSIEKIEASFCYLSKKINNILIRQRIADKDFLAEKQKFIRKLLVGNSTLLLLDLKKMDANEWFVRNDLKDVVPDYYPTFNELFVEPKYFYMINNLRYIDLYNNAETNIKNLERLVGQKNTARYIKENPYFMAMKYDDFAFLLKSIVKMDMQIGDSKFMQKFLFMGKSLFGSDYKFKVDSIIKKLREDKCRKKIEIDLKSDAQCFKKFLKLFVSDKDKQIELFDRVNKLIKFSQSFVNNSDAVRKDIEYVGNIISYLDRVIKSDDVEYKKEYIQALSESVSSVTDEIISVYGVSTFNEASKVEENMNKTITDLYKEISDIYKDKNSKVCKLYSGVGAMYERANKYLTENLQMFLSMRPLVDMFNDKVKGEYLSQVKNLFYVQETAQQSILGQGYDVKVDEKLLGSFKNLQKSFNKTYQVGDESLNFEK